MTQEEKQLLLKEFCARQFYGVKAHYQYFDFVGSSERLLHKGDGTVKSVDISIGNPIYIDGYHTYLEDTKPYLRPMSSMTEEEEGMYNLLQGISHLTEQHWTAKDGKIYRYADAIDWLNENHFDYRGLIEKGLALEAPEGMYEIK